MNRAPTGVVVDIPRDAPVGRQVAGTMIEAIEVIAPMDCL
jgi:hypothetical protein